MSGHGSAHELPAGRLASFEDDDSTPDLGALLQRRPTPETGPTQEAKDNPAKSGPVGVDEQQQAPPEPADRETPKKAAQTPKGGRPSKKAATAPTKRPAHSERANRIRSTSVHVPAPLLEQLVAYRKAEGLSNGDIVIAAIEKAHPRLGELIHPPSRAGGSLFQGRTARSVRTTDGPLTPLNVRLFENDFTVIDDLISQFGAFSRGHLITAALTDFFTER